MARRYKEGIFPLRIVATDELSFARDNLLLPNEMAEALELPEVVDKELPTLGSDRGYNQSGFVMLKILIFYSGGKNLEDLREIRSSVLGRRSSKRPGQQRWQATKCSLDTCSSRGSCSEQMGLALKHREYKRQPGGGLKGVDTSPGRIISSLRSSGCEGRAADSSACV